MAGLATARKGPQVQPPRAPRSVSAPRDGSHQGRGQRRQGVDQAGHGISKRPLSENTDTTLKANGCSRQKRREEDRRVKIEMNESGWLGASKLS